MQKSVRQEMVGLVASFGLMKGKDWKEIRECGRRDQRSLSLCKGHQDNGNMWWMGSMLE